MEIRKLNTIRGFAALTVVISHYSNAIDFMGGALGRDVGQFGVMIFFILSGFLMSYLYINNTFNWSVVKRFLISRIARVAPLFVIVVMCSYFFHVIGMDGFFYKIKDIKDLLSHLTLLHGTSVLWTIPPEIQFYIFFIFLWWVFFRWKMWLYVLMAAVFILLVILNFPKPQGEIFGLHFDTAILRSLPYFFVGVIYGQLYMHGKLLNPIKSKYFLYSLLALPVLYPETFLFSNEHNYGLWKDTSILLTISIVFFFILFLVPDDHYLLTNNTGDFLGKISYSMYMLHLPIMLLTKEYARYAPELFFVVYISISIGISYMSYTFIECPARNKIKSLFLYSKSA